MKRPLVLALAAAATLFGATAANAARVDWSIGINLPPIDAVVGGPVSAGYAPPAAYAPRVVVAPVPLWAPPPVAYLPRPRDWLPPLPRVAWFEHDRGHDGHERWHDRDDHGHDHDGHAPGRPVGWQR
jgi:hypothetical protein